MFSRFGDMFRQSSMVFTERTGLENLYSMVRYCIDKKSCKRTLIAAHFKDHLWSKTGNCHQMCDICDRGPNQKCIFAKYFKCFFWCISVCILKIFWLVFVFPYWKNSDFKYKYILFQKIKFSLLSHCKVMLNFMVKYLCKITSRAG